MKTLKIPDELHKDLRKLQAHWEIKTLPETIRALYCYYFENINGDWKNDKCEK